MDRDLIEWMMELERSDAFENATIDDNWTSAAPSSCNNDFHNDVGGMDGGQGLKEEGKKTAGKVGERSVEEYQIVEVMTDEQVEELRRQIKAFHVISENLHGTIASEFLSHHGMRIGNPSSDLLKTFGGHKLSNRKQRWSATPMQKLFLENTFHLGKVSPNKEEIRWITSQLSQHGEITESNVRNWFQNRKTREKRKNFKSEVGSSNGKKIRLEKKDFDNNQYLSDSHSFRISSQDFDMNPSSIHNSDPYDPSRMPFMEIAQPNPSNYYLMPDFGPFDQQIGDDDLFGFGSEIY